MRSFLTWFIPVVGVCALSELPVWAQGYAISTAAGLAGTNGFADGTNGSARFFEPGAVAVDPAGNLYVADTSNHAIRKATLVGSNWVITTIAGLHGASGSTDGTNSAARFNFPYGIAVDSQTNLYVADTYNNRIRKITPVGTNWVVSTFAGTGAPGSGDGPGYSATFDFPYGLTVDAAGNVFVADTYNHTIRMLVPSGTNSAVSTLAGSAGTFGFADGSNSVARFDYPSAVAVSAGTNLFVADTYNCTLRNIKPVGTNWVVTTIAGSQGINAFADGTNSNSLFDFPYGLAVDSATNLYVADAYNEAIRKVTAFGTNWVVGTVAGSPTIAGSADGIGTAALFNTPKGVAVDSAGNFYVADTVNDTVRVGRSGFFLQAALLGGKVVLSWPAGATNYGLETKATVAAGAWTPVTTGIFLVGSSFLKTNSVSGPAFYRLHKP